MGGMGSGSWYRWQGKKQVVEDALGLNITHFAQWGALHPHWQGSIQWRYGDREPFASAGYTVMASSDDGLVLTMHYRLDGREHIDQPIALQTTRPNYGGVRWWFTCPACQRRSGRLYLPSGARLFACRRCYDLTYRSAQEHNKSMDVYARLFREEARLEKLLERIARKRARRRSPSARR